MMKPFSLLLSDFCQILVKMYYTQSIIDGVKKNNKEIEVIANEVSWSLRSE